MIPKIIHYCWFGHNKKSKLIKRCIKSWEKYCPDYKIIEWNEDNFDINICPYVKEAYDEGISAAEACIRLAPEYADGYLLLGILQAEKGKKEEAKGNLLKAKELGDTRVDEYLKKYKLN